RASSLHRKYVLHTSLAVCRHPEHNRAIVILQRTRDNFGSARRFVIHQYRNGQFGPSLRGSVGEHDVIARVASSSARNTLATVEKEIGHRHSLVQQAARVRPEIQYKRCGARLHERIDGRFQLARYGVTEHGERDVADAGRQQRRALYRAVMDRRANELERYGCRGSCMLNRNLDRRAWSAAQQLLNFLGGPPADRLSIDLYDAIACEDAGLLARASRQRAHHDKRSVAHVDLETDAGVNTRRSLGQIFKALGGEVRIIRIVEFRQHSVERELVHVRVADRIDVVVAYNGAHLREQSRTVHLDGGSTALEHPRACDQHDRQNRGER